jgi:hypothetical protein
MWIRIGKYHNSTEYKQVMIYNLLALLDNLLSLGTLGLVTSDMRCWYIFSYLESEDLI